MKIGIVSYWFNRGQATVSRQLRSILDGLGHETFVLARPTKEWAYRPQLVERSDVWDQPDVTAGTSFDMPREEYEEWARRCRLDLIFFDQNYQFEEIAHLRSSGFRTVGRFVWEQFGAEHVPGAGRAFDVIYSLTRCEQERYRDAFGLETPLIPWGCHPELVSFPVETREDATYFFYPGGYLTKRKPTAAVIEAFSNVERDDVRLIVKAQRPLNRSHLIRPRTIGDLNRRRKSIFRRRDAAIATGDLDRRIVVNVDDLPSEDYRALFSSCHVCLAPSRWEGLGLHLYEATAFGMPLITNDDPPMNELVRDGHNGLLVPSVEIGPAPSGIPAYEPDVDGLRRAIESLADPAFREGLAESARSVRRELSWEGTIEGYRDLLETR